MSELIADAKTYPYRHAALGHHHEYLLPVVKEILVGLEDNVSEKKGFDLGCGNGSVAENLSRLGWEFSGVDPSCEGVMQANEHYPELHIEVGSAYDDLQAIYGQFPVVISLEVVEHVYAPRRYAKCIYDLLDVGGTAIISTPYHGYWKNVLLALSGKLDDHFTVLWEHGHIKFWSIRTLRKLLEETGFKSIKFRRVGRLPVLAKSMVAIARK